jgi:hypothetical protein
METEMGMRERPLLWAGRSIAALILVHIFARSRMGVCDGGHGADVMKKLTQVQA